MQSRVSDEIALLSASQIAAAVSRRDLSAVEVFDAVAARIERGNGLLNAIVRFDPAIGRAQAVEADRRAARSESPPLLGVPFTVKDTLMVGGLRATQGSRLFENFVAPSDSWSVARIRACGAVYIGAANCSEFAVKGVTDNPLYGITRNPWDAACTTGGSSGGGACAVAAGFGPFSLGTDAGGSIRRPAAHCGVVGMKPSHGIVPDPHGFDDPSLGMSVVGPLARSAGDVALVLECLVGYDPADPLSIPFPGNPRIDRTASEAPPKTLRIAFSRDLGCGFACDADVLDAINAAVAGLQANGYRIDEAAPNWPPGTATYEELACEQAGLAALFGEALRSGHAEFDPAIAQQIRTGMHRSGAETARAMLERRKIHASVARFFHDYDLLLCPTAPVTAWPVDSDLPHTIGGLPAGTRGHAAFTPLFNVCGVPACSVPVGLVRGLPVGLQIIGARFSDARVLQFARLIERLQPSARRPPERVKVTST